MRAVDELEVSTSCLNRALPHEIVFTLLGRDKAAPQTIREWCAERVRMNLNSPHDAQIKSALRDADAMEQEYDSIRHEIAQDSL